jgi:hypothetical protein
VCGWATGTPAPTPGRMPKPRRACPNTHCPHSLPTATVYQLPQSLPTVHSLPTVTQLANDVQITSCYSLSTATELTSCRRACQPPQSLPAVTELASCHRACQLPQSLPAATGLTNGTQLTNCHTTRFFSSLPSIPSFPLQIIPIS